MPLLRSPWRSRRSKSISKVLAKSIKTTCEMWSYVARPRLDVHYDEDIRDAWSIRKERTLGRVWMFERSKFFQNAFKHLGVDETSWQIDKGNMPSTVRKSGSSGRHHSAFGKDYTTETYLEHASVRSHYRVLCVFYDTGMVHFEAHEAVFL